jgi:hypothetical protein
MGLRDRQPPDFKIGAGTVGEQWTHRLLQQLIAEQQRTNGLLEALLNRNPPPHL